MVLRKPNQTQQQMFRFFFCHIFYFFSSIPISLFILTSKSQDFNFNHSKGMIDLHINQFLVKIVKYISFKSQIWKFAKYLYIIFVNLQWNHFIIFCKTFLLNKMYYGQSSIHLDYIPILKFRFTSFLEVKTYKYQDIIQKLLVPSLKVQENT